MPITLQNTRADLGLRGATFGQNSALDNFRRSIGGLTQGLQDIDNSRDQEATNAFQARLNNLSTQELENFNVGDAAQGSRLEQNDLQKLLANRLNESRNQKEATFQRAQTAQSRADEPRLQGFLSGLHGLGSAQAKAYTEQALNDLPADASNKLRNQIAKAGQSAFKEGVGTERSDLKYNDYLKDRAAKEAKAGQFQGVRNQLSGILANAGQTPGAERDVLNQLRNTDQYKAISDPNDRLALEAEARNLINSMNDLTSAEKQEVAAVSQAIDAQEDFKLKEAQQNLNALDAQAEAKLPLSSSVNKDKTLSKVTDIVSTLSDGFGTTNRPGVYAGRPLIKQVSDIIQNGFEIEGTKISPDQLDGETVIAGLNALHERNNAIFDEGVDLDEFKRYLLNAATNADSEKNIFTKRYEEAKIAHKEAFLGSSTTRNELKKSFIEQLKGSNQ